MRDIANCAPILLDDEQVRRYVADGFIAFDTGLEPAFHDAVAAELAVSMNEVLAVAGGPPAAPDSRCSPTSWTRPPWTAR